MKFKKNIKRKFHIEEMLDPWDSDVLYEILLTKEIDALSDAVYVLRSHFSGIDNMQKMDIYSEAYKLFKEFIDECNKRDLFYE